MCSALVPLSRSDEVDQRLSHGRPLSVSIHGYVDGGKVRAVVVGLPHVCVRQQALDNRRAIDSRSCSMFCTTCMTPLTSSPARSRVAFAASWLESQWIFVMPNLSKIPSAIHTSCRMVITSPSTWERDSRTCAEHRSSSLQRTAAIRIAPSHTPYLNAFHSGV